MSTRKIILASKSPRRQELLKEVGIDFVVKTKEVEEVFPADLEVREVAAYLSQLKAEAFLDTLSVEEVVITADTVVVHNNQILGKPKNHKEAYSMLKAYSNNHHKVITAVSITSLEKQVTFSMTTVVYFHPLSDEQINFYIEKYQPYDKAGAYGIQEWIGLVGIRSIEGSYYNVVGLPVDQLIIELANF